MICIVYALTKNLINICWRSI